MYNEIIIDRLNNLTYLSTLKNSNITAITKKNVYGDIVKFYAQINKQNVIQGISFKATGCSYFVALCSYFCEIVDGKTIEEALKIKEKDLIAFAKLDESKHHIYPLILDTFALLIKKYRKGLETGKVVPCEVVKKAKVENKQKVTKKKVDVKDGLHEILVSDTRSRGVSSRSTSGSSRLSKTEIKTTITTVTEINSEISREESKMVAISASESKKERLLAKQEAKRQAKLEKLEKKAQIKEEKRLAKESKSLSSASSEKSVAKVESNVPSKAQTTKASKSAQNQESKKIATKSSTKSSAGSSKTKTTSTTMTTTLVETKATASKTSKADIDSKTQSATSTRKTMAKKLPKASEKGTKDIVVDRKAAARKSQSSSREIVETNNDTISSLDLAIINDDKEVIVSDSIPNQGEVQAESQIVVEHVEQKRRVETIRKSGGHTTTIEAERVDALQFKAEGEDVHKQVHSATNLNDMITKLNSSKAQIRDVEAHSKISAKKSVDGKVVDSKSSSSSFSSMRDNLHRIRVNNETKALPSTETTTKSSKKEKVNPETKENSQKKGLFGWLFKK